MERQREALIEEMEGREKELLSRVENLEEDRRGLERRLKKTSSEHEFLSENNAIISSENERYVMSCEYHVTCIDQVLKPILVLLVRMKSM